MTMPNKPTITKQVYRSQAASTFCILATYSDASLHKLIEAPATSIYIRKRAEQVAVARLQIRVAG